MCSCKEDIEKPSFLSSMQISTASDYPEGKRSTKCTQNCSLKYWFEDEAQNKNNTSLVYVPLALAQH